MAKEAKSLQETQKWGEKDLAEEAARETRLSAVATSVLFFLLHSLSSMPCFSARKNNRQQLVIDLLDVWIPATGAELLNVNEGTLGLLGYVNVAANNKLIMTGSLCSLMSSLLGAKAQWKAVNGKK